MNLLQSQKNQVFESIEESGLNPNMFTFTGPDTYGDSVFLRLKDSAYFFEFSDGPDEDHQATFSPGEQTFEEREYTGYWSVQLKCIKKWLLYLIREIEAPDKWKQLEEEIKNMDFGDIEYEDVKFTYREYEILTEKIEALKSKISKLDLISEQITQINGKLDHLLLLAKDMNKTDWKELFIGSLISLFMNLSIDTSMGKTIVGYVRGVFINFLPSR